MAAFGSHREARLAHGWVADACRPGRFRTGVCTIVLSWLGRSVRFDWARRVWASGL